ncbi:hypothetical protein AB0J57_19375 [Streptomyces sp. NPDC049837]|uniref:hypothetical protein n=1 Tax=Streptomyces sp. NPDC049837 TaxID=3155277 RepID=UPI0034368C34
MSMSPAARRTGYGLGAAASVLLAMALVNSSPADAAVSHPLVKSKYFTTGSATITCPAGWVATGGGIGADLTASMYVARTEPFRNSSGTPVGWKGTVTKKANGSGGSGTLYVVCAR